jgi:tripartite-type tricarboxylate transporter receptor subunit TctC
MKRIVVAIVVAVLLLLGLVEKSTLLAAEQHANFPIKPVTVIVPAGVGGGTDINARLTSVYWEKTLGQPMFVTNKPGGSTMLGMRELKNSPPDGYTVACYAYPDLPLIPYLVGAQAGFSMDDFVTIGVYATIPGALMVKRENFKTLKEFGDAAKKEPGKLNISIAGNMWKLHVLELEEALGIKLNTIQFKSGGEGHVALLGDHVKAQMAVSSFAVTSKEKGIIPLVIMGGDKRLENFPDTPTMKELGYNVDYETLFPFVAHKSTPPAVLNKLISSFKELERNPEFVNKIKGVGYNVKPMFGADVDKYLAVKNVRLKTVVERNKDQFED